MSSSGKSALHLAADKNNVPEILRLLSLNAEVDALDNSCTPLHLAANKSRNDSHFRAIEALLKNGASVNARADDGSTALHSLVRHANVRTVELLLRRFDADVSTKDNCGQIPLHIACCSDTTTPLEIVELLVEHGSDVNCQDDDKFTALHRATLHSYNDKLFKVLLRNGGDVDAPRYFRDTPMMYVLESVSRSSYIQPILGFLLDYTDIVNTVSSRGKTIVEHWYMDHVYQNIIKHIAKLRTLELTVNPVVLEIISGWEKYEDFLKRCTKELYIAKNTKLKHCWVTFFNLLVDSKRKLKNYAGNQDLVDAFEKSECLKKFPIYGATMQKNEEKGIKNRKLFEKSSIMLSSRLPIFNPNHLIIRDVLDCLRSKDYAKLTIT